jgi:hypothetical protein
MIETKLYLLFFKTTTEQISLGEKTRFNIL